jgi:hypothetical protein
VVSEGLALKTQLQRACRLQVVLAAQEAVLGRASGRGGQGAAALLLLQRCATAAAAGRA